MILSHRVCFTERVDIWFAIFDALFGKILKFSFALLFTKEKKENFQTGRPGRVQAGQAGCRPAIMAGPHTEGPRPPGRPIWPGWGPRGPGHRAGQAGGGAGRASGHARVQHPTGSGRRRTTVTGGEEGREGAGEGREGAVLTRELRGAVGDGGERSPRSDSGEVEVGGWRTGAHGRARLARPRASQPDSDDGEEEEGTLELPVGFDWRGAVLDAGDELGNRR